VLRTAKGDVECAVLGSGPAVLVPHGGLGGFDQALGVGLALLVPEARSDLERDGIQAALDGNVPIAHAELAVAAIPLAELSVDEDCGHILWLSARYPELQRKALAFLERHANQASALR